MIPDIRISRCFMKQGISPKVVSERLEPAKMGINLGVYSHIVLEVKEVSVEMLQEILN